MPRRLFKYHSGEYPTFYYIGKKGFGKSVKGDTRLVVLINGQFRVMTIEDLHNLPKGIPIKIPAITKSKKVVWSKIKKVWKHKPDDKLYRVSTYSNREVIATGDHSFLKFNEYGSLKSVQVKELDNLDFLPLSNYVPIINPMVEISVPEIIGKDKTIYEGHKVEELLNVGTGFNQSYGSNITEYTLRNWSNGNYGKINSNKIYSRRFPDVNPVDSTIPFSWEFGYIIGFYLGDGSISKVTEGKNRNRTRITFFNNSKELLLFLKSLLEELGFNNISLSKREREVYFNSRPFVALIENLFGFGSHNKSIPINFLNSPVEFRQGLVAGYFDSDGTVDKGSGRVRIESVSKELHESVKMILISLGILYQGSIIKRKAQKSVSYGINIPPAEVHKILDCKVYHPDKLKILYKFKGNRRADNFYNQNAYAKQKVYYNRPMFRCINSMSSSMDFVADRVKNIEEVKGNDEYVFDIETEHQNFMLANGLFVHNSTAAEWSAEKYKKAKYLIVDMFDAGDFEACYWAIRDCPKCHRAIRYDQKVCPRCQVMPRSNYKVLLVVPDDVEVEIGDPNFELISTEEGLGNIISKAIKTDKIVSVACGLFDKEELYYTLAEWMHQWLQLNRDVFMRDTVFLLREAANIAFARHKLYDNQKLLRKAVFELVRESRHYQTTILFDTQRYMDLDIGVRGNIENIIMKRHNEHAMPDVVKLVNKQIQDKRWKWFQKGIKPEAINKVQPEIPYLRKNEFYVKFDDGSFAFHWNGFPSFHHRGPKDYFRFLSDVKYKQELFTFKKQEESIKRAPKIMRMKLATDMITDGMDEEEVAKYLKTRPSTVEKWVEEYQTKYAKPKVETEA